ncbi:hypothetical protein PanWU01x14_338810 [Parasponia andersonii]|uniref:AtC3H23-like CCCH zinc finger domain-containing protein n=1 Tax=Parasponia andersonii TaxID=3476 RepID=A0A2P5AF24_PARAD|nr:hypothetical protein PanWU01x14_338810 [Parasponia andersonii]
MADLPRPWVVEPHETLWDNTISSHDEYMMTRYKVYECPNKTRDRSHIWRDCHFNLPGDLYGRRNPRMGQYCKPYRGLAHGVMETVLHPDFYRANMCPNGLTYHHRPCGFAHYPDELRPVVKKWRRAALVDDHDVDDEDNSIWTVQDKTSCSTSLEVDGEILPAELQVHAR